MRRSVVFLASLAMAFIVAMPLPAVANDGLATDAKTQQCHETSRWACLSKRESDNLRKGQRPRVVARTVGGAPRKKTYTHSSCGCHRLQTWHYGKNYEDGRAQLTFRKKGGVWRVVLIHNT